MAQLSKTFTIFIIDHDLENLLRFRRYFAGKKFLVYFLKNHMEAQAVMAGVVPDIIICRVDSPDGEEVHFLELLQYKYPRTIRIVVSDEKNRSLLFKLLISGLTQRFLCFPWQKNHISDVLDRDLATRSMIRATSCWSYLEKGRNMPNVPTVVREIEQLLCESEYSLGQVSRIIEREPILASRLLQIVNSAAFTKSGTVSDLLLALSYIGVHNLREILLFISAIEGFSFDKRCMQMVKGIANHSFLCSRLAREIASQIDPSTEKEASIAALLHDMGKLILLANSCPQLIKAISKTGDNGHLWVDKKFEDEYFGFRYSEIGSCLMLLWNLPMSLIEIVVGIEYPLLELSGTAKSVAIADRCLQEAAVGGDADLELETLIPALPVAKWRLLAREFIDSSDKIF